MRDFEYIDALYRSRITMLDILESQGFEVSKYRGFSPLEVQAMNINMEQLGLIDVNHKKNKDKKARLIYLSTPFNRKKTDKIIKMLQSGFVDDDDYISEEDALNLTTYVMVNETVSDIHHLESNNIWLELKLRVYFCSIYNFVNNPLKHILVPTHEIVPSEQHEQLLKDLFINQKTQLPIIKYHIDPVTRCLGASPGDIIKITRPSPSSGEYILYRLCAP
jgi:DNA-directed RNA polymerase subunit H